MTYIPIRIDYRFISLVITYNNVYDLHIHILGCLVLQIWSVTFKIVIIYIIHMTVMTNFYFTLNKYRDLQL